MRRALQIHFGVAFAVVAALALVNLLFVPGFHWWALVAVGWGVPLAIHTAFAMGLFGSKDG
ncbi:MAG: 2TM domain-containing protein [Telmatospirillum sp.]|nr:2TM domain-containing protein [Telmatospirillum sp.]